jgi:hypothetical protein
MPARLRDVARVLRTYGIDVREPTSGSHWKATNGATSYPLPAHDGLKEELSDVYLRKLCRAFGLDYAEFRAKL